ncbi:MAG: hypothetical protein MUE81_18690 [Thermoflexibacter sp.]|nr:hypothetical protein [Thermoflexibacter sp.]
MNKIKELVKSIQKQHKQLVAEWDAGGDSTPCWFSIIDKFGKEENREEYSKKYEEEFDSLRNYIISELNLPNAGEYYNKGKGVIGLEDDKVVIRYSAKEFTNENEDSMIEFSLEDRFGLLDLQYKANITFSLGLGEKIEMNYDILEDDEEEEEKDNFMIELRILEGDEIFVSQEMFTYYKTQFEEVGKRFETELGLEIDGKTLQEILISYNERDEVGKGFLKIEKYYEWHKLHENEEVVLID